MTTSKNMKITRKQLKMKPQASEPEHSEESEKSISSGDENNLESTSRDNSTDQENLRLLDERFKLIKTIYDPDQLNLLFENIPRVDEALFESLLALMRETWEILSPKKFSGFDIDAEMLLMEIFEFLLNAFGTVLEKKAQSTISMVIISRLVELVVETSQYTMRNPGDITKRNISALSSLISVFDQNGNLAKLANQKAISLNDDEVFRFIVYSQE